jgi:hypothetical protein
LGLLVAFLVAKSEREPSGDAGKFYEESEFEIERDVGEGGRGVGSDDAEGDEKSNDSDDGVETAKTAGAAGGCRCGKRGADARGEVCGDGEGRSLFEGAGDGGFEGCVGDGGGVIGMCAHGRPAGTGRRWVEVVRLEVGVEAPRLSMAARRLRPR